MEEKNTKEDKVPAEETKNELKVEEKVEDLVETTSITPEKKSEVDVVEASAPEPTFSLKSNVLFAESPER